MYHPLRYKGLFRAAMCRFKFAVLIVGTLLDFRYRRIAMYASGLLFVMKFAGP